MITDFDYTKIGEKKIYTRGITEVKIIQSVIAQGITHPIAAFIPGYGWQAYTLQGRLSQSFENPLDLIMIN